MEITIKVAVLIISLLAIVVSIVAMIRVNKSERDLIRALENLNRPRAEFLKNSCDNYAEKCIVDDARAALDEADRVIIESTKSMSRLVDAASDKVKTGTKEV